MVESVAMSTTPLTGDSPKWITVLKTWYAEDIPDKRISEAIYFSVVFAVLNKQIRSQMGHHAALIAALDEAVKLDGGSTLDLNKALNFFSSVLPGFEWGPAARSAVLANIPH